MKTKKIGKKLVLNKETIVNLKNKEMIAVNGGELPPPSDRSNCHWCLSPSDTCRPCSDTC